MSTRQSKFKELQSLIQLQANNALRPNTHDTIGDIIDELLEELYPIGGECTGDMLTCERPDCCMDADDYIEMRKSEASCADELYKRLMDQDCQVPVSKIKLEPSTLKDHTRTPTYEEFMAAINEAAEPEVEYMTLAEGLARLQDFQGGRLARTGWDNGLNQEYITYLPFVGIVKIFQTSSVKAEGSKPYFKNVVHTFEGTKDDDKANDWYFL